MHKRVGPPVGKNRHFHRQVPLILKIFLENGYPCRRFGPRMPTGGEGEEGGRIGGSVGECAWERVCVRCVGVESYFLRGQREM